jgi:tetratricopeptide (TPR) repeat protein
MEITMKPATIPLLLAALLASASLPAPASAVDNVISSDAPDLTSVRAKIKAKDFKTALAELTPMLQTHQHADVYNLMGFSLRKTGDYKQAYTFYRKALDFNPEHKGALEYLGELYVETGQVEKARENVALLKKLCPGGCEELEDLEQAIAAAPKTNAAAKAN